MRDAIKNENEAAHVQLLSLQADWKRQKKRLKSAIETVSNETLQQSVDLAHRTVDSESRTLKAAEESLVAKNPEQVKALAETAENSLGTCQQRRKDAETELTEVQTRLKIHGEQGLYDKLQGAKTDLERVSTANRSLFRRAAAARFLYEIMRHERDDARRAYVAP